MKPDGAILRNIIEGQTVEDFSRCESPTDCSEEPSRCQAIAANPAKSNRMIAERLDWAKRTRQLKTIGPGSTTPQGRTFVKTSTR